MFVISRFIYDAMAKSKQYAELPYLRILNYEPGNHKQTFYKFRFGARDDGGRVAGPEVLKLGRGESAAIWSLEGFELSERVLGIFGHASELFLRGAELVHSPFIDPSFRGQLQIRVRNASEREFRLQPGDTVGKVMFFDISDSILSAEDLLADVQKNAQNEIRQRAIGELAKVMGDLQT